MLSFRKAVADWYKQRFHVTLDPANEVLTLIGSKEGIGHIHLAFVDPGDFVLVPSPGYPVYPVATNFAGGKVHIMPLTKKTGFLPDLKAVPAGVARKARLMFLNSPNNPTSVVMSREYFGDAIAFAKKHKIIICHDAAYSEIYYDGRRPASFLEVEGAKDVGIEFHSLSKTYNMAGWRIGFAVGGRRLIAALARVKSYLDYGAFTPIQVAATAALNGPQDCIAEMRARYKGRRDVLIEGLAQAGWDVPSPQASMFAWAPIPEMFTHLGSLEFSKLLLEKAGVAVSPGVGFGQYGDEHVRFALIENEHRTKQAVRKIKRALGKLLD